VAYTYSIHTVYTWRYIAQKFVVDLAPLDVLEDCRKLVANDTVDLV
jgi:hypothetical protein